MSAGSNISLLTNTNEAKENILKAQEMFSKKRTIVKSKFNFLISQTEKIQDNLKNRERHTTLNMIIKLETTLKRNSTSNCGLRKVFNTLSQIKEKENINLIKCFDLREQIYMSKAQIKMVLAEKFFKSLTNINDFESIQDSYLNKVDLNAYRKLRSSIGNILTDETKELLYQILLKSKLSDSVSLAASNAITLLNKYGFSFVNKDLSRIKIPNADLSWGLFINTNFESSYLCGVNFSRAHLYDSNFRNCNMANVDFGQILNPGHEENAEIIKFSPCSRFLAISIKSKIFLYNAKNYKKITHLVKGKKFIKFLLFSDNGNYLVSSTNDERVLWDTSTMLPIVKFCNGGMHSCFSPCNSYLCLVWNTYSDQNIIKIYSIKTKSWANEINWMDPYLHSVSFSPSAENLLCWDNDNVSIWNLSKRTKISEIYCNSGYGYKIIISFNRKYIYIPVGNEKILLYSSEKLELLTVFAGIFNISNVSYCGRFIAYAYSSSIKIFNLSKGKDHSEIFSKKSLEFHPSGAYVLAKSSCSSSELWKMQINCEDINKKLLWREEIAAVSFSDDNKLFAVLDKKWWISIFFTENKNLLIQFNCNFGANADLYYRCHKIAWSDTALACMCYHSIKIFNAYDGSLLKTITNKFINSKYIEFSPDGKLLISYDHPNYVEIWDIDSSDKIFLLESYCEGHTRFLWSQLGDFTISSNNQKINPRSKENQKSSLEAKNYSELDILSQLFCEKYLISCGDCEFKVGVWYLRDLKNVIKVKEFPHYNPIRSVVWSHDNKHIIAGDYEGRIIVWNYDGGKKVIKNIKAHKREVFPISLSKIGHFISCGERENAIKLWKLDWL